MKKYVFLLLFTFNGYVQAQNADYLPYHLYRAKAERNIYTSAFDSALANYRNAFHCVPEAFAKDVYNAALCAALVKDTSSLFPFMETALKKGVPWTRFDTNRFFSGYSGLTAWKHIREQLPYYDSLYQSRINRTYRKTLDSLNLLDQQARKHLFFVYNFPKSKPAEKNRAHIAETDCGIRQTLLHSIAQYGYPSERNVGINPQSLMYFTDICVWHQTDSLFLQIEEEAFRNGKMDVERYVAKKGYTGECFNYVYRCGADTEETDKNRAAIGFPTSADFKRMKNFYTQTHNQYGFVLFYAAPKNF